MPSKLKSLIFQKFGMRLSIGKLLGAGAFGKVHKAILEDDTNVAIKSMKKRDCQYTNIEGEKVISELYYWKKLKKCQSCVQLLMFTEDCENIYFIMEYLPGI